MIKLEDVFIHFPTDPFSNNQFRIKHVHAIDFNVLRLTKISQQVTRLEIINLLKQTFKTHGHLTLLPLSLLVVVTYATVYTSNKLRLAKECTDIIHFSHKPYLKLISFFLLHVFCTFHLVIRVLVPLMLLLLLEPTFIIIRSLLNV